MPFAIPPLRPVGPRPLPATTVFSLSALARPRPNGTIAPSRDAQGNIWYQEAQGWHELEDGGPPPAKRRKGGSRDDDEDDVDDEVGQTRGRRGRPKGSRSKKASKGEVGFLADPDPREALVPPSDLLRSISQRSTTYYASHVPTLLDEASHRSFLEETATSKSQRRRRPNAACAEEDGGDENNNIDDEDNDPPPSRGFPRGNAIPLSSPTPLSKKANQSKSKRGKYLQRRDMYRALDGDSLIALGILVEEQIRLYLELAGYGGDLGSVSDDDVEEEGSGDDDVAEEGLSSQEWTDQVGGDGGGNTQTAGSGGQEGIQAPAGEKGAGSESSSEEENSDEDYKQGKFARLFGTQKEGGSEESDSSDGD